MEDLQLSTIIQAHRNEIMKGYVQWNTLWLKSPLQWGSSLDG